MASDLTKPSGAYGRHRGIVNLVSQSQAANTSTIRVRSILYHDGTSTAWNGNGVAVVISGSVSASVKRPLNVPGGGSSTIYDENFTISHNSDGTRATLAVNVNLGETGTTTFGNPPTINLDLSLPRIPKKPGTPGTPSLSFTAPSSVKVSWNAPSDSGGDAIDSYRVQYADNASFSGASSVVTTARSYTISGLAIDKTWYFRVSATNGIGTSAYSSASNYAIPGVPYAPATPSNTFTAPQRVVVSWTAPNNNGAGITEYIVQYAENSSFITPGAVSTTSLSYTFNGLGINKTWYFRVLAKNSQGTGSFSGATSRYIPNVPGTPTGLTTSLTPPSSVDVTWTAPSNGGAAITSYLIEYSTSSSFATTSSTTSTSTSVRLTGLTPGVTYYIRVRAINSQGSGPVSATATRLITAGPRVKRSGTYPSTVAYVRSGGVWRLAIPYVKVKGVWTRAGG